MNSDNLILRETNNPPLTNKNDFITSAEIDSNFINLYNDLLALAVTTGVIAYNAGTTYNPTTNEYATYDGRLWEWIDGAPGSNVTPGTDPFKWLEVFPTKLAHRKNSDTILAEGTSDEVTAAEIRAFINGGLTTTTNLSLNTFTSDSINLDSSTGTGVTIPDATETVAGLLNATDKKQLLMTSGLNTGDQTLASLNGEDLDNKATDFTTVNHTLYPTVEAVSVHVQALFNTFENTNIQNSDMIIDSAGARYLELFDTNTSDKFVVREAGAGNNFLEVKGDGVFSLTNSSGVSYFNSNTSEIVRSAKQNIGEIGTAAQYALNVYSRLASSSGIATMKNYINQNIFDFRQVGGAPTLGLYNSSVEQIYLNGSNGDLRVKGDFKTTESNKGLVVKDRTNGNNYRIYTDGGVLSVELA